MSSIASSALFLQLSVDGSAFVKEGEELMLNEVGPLLSALLYFLRTENGGVRIHELKSYYSESQGREVFEMSDGLTYAKDDQSKWYIILD